MTPPPSADPGAAPRAPVATLRIPTADPAAPPPLRPWSRVWRYLAAVGIGLMLWLAVTVDLLPEGPDGEPGEVTDAVGTLLFFDLLLCAVGLCLLPMRRRWPVLVAAITASFSAVSASSLGPAAVATVSMSTRRRWRGVAVVATVWVLATVVYEGFVRPSVLDEGLNVPYAMASGGFALAACAVFVVTGYYIGARRELFANLQERAETAEREQALKAEAAREAERTRIAREMHDVLAHRISLVAMHAGALAYRSDLSPEQTAEAAGVIQDNAHLALTELRQVLGVLRAGGGDRPAGAGPGPGHTGERPAEPPQPTLDQLDTLLAETTDTGAEVELDTTGLPEGAGSGLGELPATASRTAYRIIQEALTNARKHAPGTPVEVRLGGRPGGVLTIEVRNLLAVAGSRPAAPGAGMGLTGLTERAELVGGTLEHGVEPDGSFAVRAWLPWEHNE